MLRVSSLLLLLLCALHRTMHGCHLPRAWCRVCGAVLMLIWRMGGLAHECVGVLG